jgi:5'-AMP-activated protein kinase catalytic alpha subunit
MISGITYLHESGICHRDLKPENLLLDYDLTLKIVDFGLSNFYEPSGHPPQNEEESFLKTACGSPCYAAPEMISGKKYDGLMTDIWSTGVILFAMVTGFLPFEDTTTANLYRKILDCDYKAPKFISKDLKHFMSKILVAAPLERI